MVVLAGILQRSCQRLVRELPASGKHVEILCRLVEAGCTPSIGGGNLVVTGTAARMDLPAVARQLSRRFGLCFPINQYAQNRKASNL